MNVSGARAGRDGVALVVVDVLNDYEHEDADRLTRSARKALPSLRALVETAREHDVLTVYVNDHHGDWSADRERIARRAGAGAAPDLVEPLAPADDVPFLVKARHSAFYATQLEHLLRARGVQRVMLAGQVTEQCILYSALDAHVREFDVVIPRDAVAHIDEDLASAALRMMGENMSADVVDDAGAAAILRGA